MPRRNPGMIALIALIAATAAAQAQSKYGIGHPATPDEIAGWNIDIGRDGSGLPPGPLGSRIAGILPLGLSERNSGVF